MITLLGHSKIVVEVLHSMRFYRGTSPEHGITFWERTDDFSYGEVSFSVGDLLDNHSLDRPFV